MTNTRTIRRDALARCPFSGAIEYAEGYLRKAAERGIIAELVVETSIGVTVTDDYTDPARRHDALEFRWRPRSRWLPTGRAFLTVRPHAPQGSELQFSIAYEPPFATAGRLFDALIGRHIAWVTCGMLLRRLRIEIERSASRHE